MRAEIKFGELFAVPLRNGVSYPSNQRGTGVAMVNMKEIFAYDRISDQECELAPLTEKERSTCLLESWDLLFARQSLTYEGAGKCSLVLPFEGNRTFESHIMRVRLSPEIASAPFYYYYFRSPQGRRNIETIVQQVAAAGIRGSDLARLTVPFPPLSQQRAIAGVLGALDDKIAANNRIADLTVQLGRALWAKLSSGAEEISLADVVEIGLSGVWGEDEPSAKSSTQVYTLRGRDIEDLARRRPVTPPQRWISSAQGRTRIAESAMEIWTAGSGSQLGPTVLVTPELRQSFDLPVVYSNFVKRLVAKVGREDMMPSAWFAMWAEWDRNGFENFKTGTAFPNLDAIGLLKGLSVPEVRERHLEQVKTWAALILRSELSDENRSLTATRDALLPQLMSGKLQVKDVEKVLEDAGV